MCVNICMCVTGRQWRGLLPDLGRCGDQLQRSQQGRQEDV